MVRIIWKPRITNCSSRCNSTTCNRQTRCKERQELVCLWCTNTKKYMSCFISMLVISLVRLSASSYQKLRLMIKFMYFYCRHSLNFLETKTLVRYPTINSLITFLHPQYIPYSWFFEAVDLIDSWYLSRSLKNWPKIRILYVAFRC